MAIKIYNTKDIKADDIKILVYGATGAGKTVLASTLPGTVLVLSAEKGLLSIKDKNIDFVQILSLQDLQEVYADLLNPESEIFGKYQSIALDSISEMAEKILSAEKATTKDARQAYGEMQDEVGKLLRDFRDIPNLNVLFLAKMEKSVNEIGQMVYMPFMPGTKLGQQLPYFFDEVFVIRVEAELQDDGTTLQVRFLQTGRDFAFEAKDRSGLLDMYEPANLTTVINKIKGGKSE